MLRRLTLKTCSKTFGTETALIILIVLAVTGTLIAR